MTILGGISILLGLCLGYYSGYWFEAERYWLFLGGMLGMLALVFLGVS